MSRQADHRTWRSRGRGSRVLCAGSGLLANAPAEGAVAREMPPFPSSGTVAAIAERTDQLMDIDDRQIENRRQAWRMSVVLMRPAQPVSPEGVHL